MQAEIRKGQYDGTNISNRPKENSGKWGTPFTFEVSLRIDAPGALHDIIARGIEKTRSFTVRGKSVGQAGEKPVQGKVYRLTDMKL